MIADLVINRRVEGVIPPETSHVDLRHVLTLPSFCLQDDYDAESLVSFPSNKLAVFLISTYGEGDPPDNAVSFCGSIEKMHKKGTRLDRLRYCAMGMGNSNYQYYNRTMKVCRSRARTWMLALS